MLWSATDCSSALAVTVLPGVAVTFAGFRSGAAAFFARFAGAFFAFFATLRAMLFSLQRLSCVKLNERFGKTLGLRAFFSPSTSLDCHPILERALLENARSVQKHLFHGLFDVIASIPSHGRERVATQKRRFSADFWGSATHRTRKPLFQGLFVAANRGTRRFRGQSAYFRPMRMPPSRRTYSALKYGLRIISRAREAYSSGFPNLFGNGTLAARPSRTFSEAASIKGVS